MAFSELIALYLFLGGTAAGAFAVMSVLDLHASAALSHRLHPLSARRGNVPSRQCAQHVSKLVYGASFAMLLAGLLCLLADLGKPQAFYYLFIYPTASFMSIGSFALALLVLLMAVVLADSVLELGERWRKAARVARVVGIAVALVVMLYTGMLLKTVISVPVWQSWWLPVLFLFSALSCGCAVVIAAGLLSAGFKGASTALRRLAALDAAFIMLETVAIAAYALSVNSFQAHGPLDALLIGDAAWLFWAGFVGCGIAAPLVIDVIALIRRRDHVSGVVAMAATLVLIGGLALRFALVGAGVSAAI
jgi:formate-dependent nitrite reductase membrane component NrfD